MTDEATVVAASGRSPWWHRPLVILGFALAVRLLTGVPALRVAPFSDEAAYHHLAVRLASGQGYTTDDGRPTSWRPPLWPGVLAGLYRVTGPSAAAARVLQMVLGTLLVGLVILLARAMEPGDARVPAIAGWWAAVSPAFLYHSHSLFSETPFGLCLGLVLYAMLRGRRSLDWCYPLLAGVGLGLASLCRGSTVLLVPVVLVWWTWSHAHGPRLGGWRALATMAVCLVVVAPWTARNYRVHHGFVLVDSNSAVNLFYGNNPRTPQRRPWEVVELERVPWPRVRPDAGEVEVQRAAMREAALYIRAHPRRFARGLAVKTGNLWGLSRGLASGVGAGLYGRPSLPKQVLAALWDGLDGLALLCLGTIGMGLARQRNGVELQTLLIAFLTVVHAPSYGHSRYRFGALLLLFGYSAAAVLSTRTWRTDLAELPAWRRRWVYVGVGLLVANWLYEVIALELVPRLGHWR